MPPCLTDGSPRISTKELWFFDTVSVSVVKYSIIIPYSMVSVTDRSK